MGKMTRLLSLRALGKRIRVTSGTAKNLVRRGVLLPDFKSEAELLFHEDRVPELQGAAQARKLVALKNS